MTVARNTVDASIGVDAVGYGLPQLPNGYVVAYRAAEDLSLLLP